MIDTTRTVTHAFPFNERARMYKLIFSRPHCVRTIVALDASSVSDRQHGLICRRNMYCTVYRTVQYGDGHQQRPLAEAAVAAHRLAASN